jgi:outer membrane scaffolding protein for murein synthesis (MipA/OmpV family)
MFEVDNGGIKKSLFDIDGLSMDVSLSGSLPVDSKSSKLREGMDDLDFVFEVGPKLSYDIWQEEEYKLSFRLPIRNAFSTNFQDDIQHRGFFTSPQFKISQKTSHRELSFTSGAVFATQRYHDYFYGVDEAYETATRHAYKGKGGYGGWRNKLSFFDQKGAWVYDAYVVHYLLEGVAFEDSPLVEEKNGIFVQVSLSYIFYTK